MMKKEVKTMKYFEEPKMEVLKFSVQDIITTSEVEEEPTYDPMPCF